MSDYGFTVEVPEGYDEAVARTRIAMRTEGFSIITEMHVGGLLGPEAGSARQYLIMGAWNSAAERDIDNDLKVAVHLPCNVVVQEMEGGAIVAALDPREGADEATDLPAGIADAALAALTRMLERVGTSH